MNGYVRQLLESHRYSLDCDISDQRDHIESISVKAAKAEQHLAELIEQRSDVAAVLNG